MTNPRKRYISVEAISKLPYNHPLKKFNRLSNYEKNLYNEMTEDLNLNLKKSRYYKNGKMFNWYLGMIVYLESNLFDKNEKTN